jgi:hypothetical protein
LRPEDKLETLNIITVEWVRCMFNKELIVERLLLLLIVESNDDEGGK